MEDKGYFKLLSIPEYATNNAHMFCIIVKNALTKDKLLAYLKKNDIGAVFHYLSLHKSDFYKLKHDSRELLMSDFYTDCLIRLPLFYELTLLEITFICDTIKLFFNNEIK